jgi:DNA replication protein DnaC
MPGEPGFGEMVSCPCPAGAAIVQRRQDRVWQEAGIPPKFSRYTLDSLARIGGKAPLADVLASWQVSRSWLLLWGPPGTCKSGAAAALLRARQGEGRQGLFMLLNRVLDRMQATFGASDNEPGYQEAFKTLVDAELLVLDDIGANGKPLSSWGAEQLFKIVDARDLSERQTILTTNLPAGGGHTTFAQYVGGPTWSRIRGRCGRWIVETTGPDQRGREGEES